MRQLFYKSKIFFDFLVKYIVIVKKSGIIINVSKKREEVNTWERDDKR